MKPFFVHLLILLFFFPLSWAKETPYLFQQITPEQGLAYQVNSIAVSERNGCAWMGTHSGIGRFNGYELKQYLTSNVFQLVEDAQYQVWAATAEGLFRYNYFTDHFEAVYDAHNQRIRVQTICYNNQSLFFGGVDRIYQYNYDQKKIVREISLGTEHGYTISQMHLWDERTLVISSRWDRTYLVDIESGKITETLFPCSHLAATMIDHNGYFWFSTYGKGVRCYNRKGELMYEFHKNNSDLTCNVVLSLAEHEGKVWVGTDGSGIFILDPETRKVEHLTHLPGDPNSLPSNSINSLYADSNSGVWAGSIRSGLFNIKEVGIKLYSDALPNTHLGLSVKSVLSLYQESDQGDIWIGTDGGGLNRFVPAEQRFYHQASTWGDKVVSIIGVGSQYLLISLFGEGVFYFNKTTGQLEPLIIVNEKINAGLCQQGKSVNLMRHGTEFVLLLSEDPYCYNWKRRTFQKIEVDNDTKGLVGELKPLVFRDKVAYVYDNKHIYSLSTDLHVLHSLLAFQGDTVINSASMDEYGDIWMGSNQGLCRYSPETGQRTCIATNLSSNLQSVICDQRGRVWIGCNEQLFAWLINQRSFILYGSPDGVAPNEFLPKPRLLGSNGDVYLGTVNGLLCIDHDLPQELITHPVLELGEVFVGGSRVAKQIGKTFLLEIREQSNPVTLTVLARNKDIFRKPVYRYTIQRSGQDPVYSYQPSFSFSGLPVGTYQVTAACSTRLGGWTKEYPVLEVIVSLPWYKSVWFWLPCIILLVLGFVVVSFWFIRRKEERLKWAMKEHEQQVYEEKVRFLININHELRTPLTLIHAPLKQLLEKIAPDDEKYRIVQGIANQSARMKKLINMVLDVRKMEVKESVLQLENVWLQEWLSQILEDFRPEADMKHLHLVTDFESKDLSLCCDQEKCTTVVTNLLVNALKYSNEGGEICLHVRLNEAEKKVRISISDQGVGLKNVDVSKLFTRFYQGNNSQPGTGIGLSYAKILVEQHGGSIGAFDHVDGPGATFWFELPLSLQPSEVSVQPQAYLNDLLASVNQVQNVPATLPYREETKEKCLLIVDDNQEMISYLTSALQPYFKKIITAYNGVEALKRCKEVMPDAVVSDIQMPEMNGYELCKQIKEDFEISHTPVLLLTALTDEESKSFGYKNGADNYLTKPFEISTLYTAIYSLLKNRERMKSGYTEVGAIPTPTPEESTFSPVDEQFLQKLNDVVMKNLSSPDLGVPFLCSELAISRASLYNKLKALTGMGANNYISKMRIEHSVELLTTTGMNINEISDAVGFSTSRYFNKVFKEMMGCTPSQYKEQLKK